METGLFREFKKVNALERVQITAGSAGVRGPTMAEGGHVGGRPLVPSMSGGFSFQEASNVQEVPSWSHNRPLHSDQSSEDDQGCVPASQSSSPIKLSKLSHRSNESFYKRESRKEEPCLFEEWMVATRQVSSKDIHCENTGQPPPEQVRETMLHQDALFREQVQELHRLHKIQTMLMSEVKKRGANQCATPGQVNPNNRSSWTTFQAPTMEKDSMGSGSVQQHESESQRVDKDVTTSRSAEVEQKMQPSQGGRKLGKRRTFDLELPPEENMDEDEAEDTAAEGSSRMEVEEVELRLMDARPEPVVKAPQQYQVSAASENSCREAPYRPTPTMATQSVLGGLWGLNLERKMEERNEDSQSEGGSQMTERRPFQVEVKEKFVHPSAPWLSQSNGSASALPRPQPQEVRSEGVCAKEQQKARPWATTAKGAFRAGPVMAMRSPPKAYGPYCFTEEGLPVFPTLREGDASTPGYAPAGYTQGYPLTATAVPALGVQLRPPYEGPLKIPGQGLLVPTVNAAWYSDTAPFRPQQSVPPAGWQQITAFHATPGQMYAIPAGSACSLGLNVDGMWGMPEDLSAASWSATNNGPPFSPFSIIPPPKPPFKKPPKLVLWQDGTTMELKLASPKKDQSPSASSDEAGGVAKEEERQGEGSTSGQGGNGHAGAATRGITGHGSQAGGRREREECNLVGSDCERAGPLSSKSKNCNPTGTGNSAADSPAQGSMEHVGDEGDRSDRSGSAETGVGNVINPGEHEDGFVPAFGSRGLHPAGEGEEGVDMGEFRRSFCVSENPISAAEGRVESKKGLEAMRYPQGTIPSSPGQDPARETCHQYAHGACDINCNKEGNGEGTLPIVDHLSRHGFSQAHAPNPPPVKDIAAKSHEQVEGPEEGSFVEGGQDSRSKPLVDIEALPTATSLTKGEQVPEAAETTKDSDANSAPAVAPSKDPSAGESRKDETNSGHS